MEIRDTPVADLVPYEHNARTHSDEQIEQIAASIREFGFNDPVACDEHGVLIEGHGRLMAAKQLGMASVPCIHLHHLSDAQRRAYIIAHNRLPEEAGWDLELLASEVQAIVDAGVASEKFGYSQGDVSVLLASATREKVDPDNVPEVEEGEPVSQPGDVWVLGMHRLMMGDSCDAHSVAELLAGDVPRVMVTDPPYGVEYDPKWRTKLGLQRNAALGLVQNDHEADWTAAWRNFPGDVCYIWHASLKAAQVMHSIDQASFALRSQIIWDKGRIVVSRCHYHMQHEPCFYAVRKGRSANWVSDRKQSSVWYIDGNRKNTTGHSTQKPIECMARPIRHHCSAGDTVYEPFSGSGSTIMAGETEGHGVRAMEIHGPYVDLAVRRWQEFTGKEAVLDSIGRTFEEVSTDGR